ncbi:MAG: hypothetical protein P4M01_13670 [Acidobacteriota bacterium]|nr:hypothetical protein [Acidobacteriota bacterium]
MQPSTPAAAQLPVPQTAPQSADESTPQAATQAPEPAHHISEAEARELFRSVDEILKFASEHSGLPIQHPVKKKLATRDEVARYVAKRLKEQGGGERFDVTARSMKKLGILPPDFNLRQYMLDMYREQVEGWYDSKSKTVYLLDWVAPELQRPVMAHELVHALQDQNYNLEEWLNVRKDSADDTGQMVIDEERAARQSIIEGQAMIVLYDYQLADTGETVEKAPSLVESMRAGMTDDSDSVYGKAPIYLREGLLFPYTFGTDFEVRVLLKRGKQAAFAGVMEHPPLDTHQVMEPSMYLSGEPQVQVPVVPIEQVLGKQWRREDFGGLGEIDLRVMLLQWSGEDAAKKLSPAWRGGYYMALVNRKNKTAPLALALLMNFTNPDAASEFAKIYGTALGHRYHMVQPIKPGQWETEDGPVQLTVEGSSVIAVESFPQGEAVRVRDALADAAHRPVEVSPAR